MKIVPSEPKKMPKFNLADLYRLNTSLMFLFFAFLSHRDPYFFEEEWLNEYMPWVLGGIGISGLIGTFYKFFADDVRDSYVIRVNQQEDKSDDLN